MASVTRGAVFVLVGLQVVSAAWRFPPPLPSFTPDQKPLPFGAMVDEGDVDIVSGSRFNGLRTYANLPYVNCLSDGAAEADGGKYDIAIMGAPFDTVSPRRGPPPGKGEKGQIEGSFHNW